MSDQEWIVSISLGIDELKAELVRHHAWIENYFDHSRPSLAQRIEALEEQMADLAISRGSNE